MSNAELFSPARQKTIPRTSHNRGIKCCPTDALVPKTTVLSKLSCVVPLNTRIPMDGSTIISTTIVRHKLPDVQERWTVRTQWGSVKALLLTPRVKEPLLPPFTVTVPFGERKKTYGGGVSKEALQRAKQKAKKRGRNLTSGNIMVEYFPHD